MTENILCSPGGMPRSAACVFFARFVEKRTYFLSGLGERFSGKRWLIMKCLGLGDEFLVPKCLVSTLG